MVDLLVVLQTHTKGNNQVDQGDRYTKTSKSEVTKRCVRSLVKSLNQALIATQNGINIRLQVFDDHSDPADIETLKETLRMANFQNELVHLETYGIMPSILKCYEYGHDYGKDLVYFVQDDYLYDDDAIFRMVEFILASSNNYGIPVSIFPYNDPYRYLPHNIVEKCTILQGADRHWRQNLHSSSCMMTFHSVVKEYWRYFKAMGLHPVEPGMEDNTINKMYIEHNMPLFTPIPSLALHMQFDTEKDPYIDWKSWWEKHGDPATTSPKFNEEKTVLNVGAGPVPFESPFFKTYTEIRMDANTEALPDIVGTLLNMSNVPTESVDAVWASHVIEHVYFHELPKAFNEIRRVIKPDGIAVLACPDIQYIAKMLEAGDILEKVYDAGQMGPILALDMLYGHRGWVEQYPEFMSHKTGFTKKSMEQIVSSLGFEHAYIERRDGELLTILSKKPLTTELIENVRNNYR